MAKTYHALVCCRAGMGSSMMLKINADERVPSAIGITNIVDKAEMKQKLEAWLAEHAE